MTMFDPDTMDETVMRDDGIDRTPLCPWCNQPMESTGEFREIDLDAGFVTLLEEVYECRDCDDYDEQEEQ